MLTGARNFRNPGEFKINYWKIRTKKKKEKYGFAFCYKKEKTTHQHGGVLSGLQYGEVGVFGFPHLGLDTNADGLPRFVGVADDAVCRRAFSSTTCMLVPLQQVKNEIAQTGRGW